MANGYSHLWTTDFRLFLKSECLISDLWGHNVTETTRASFHWQNICKNLTIILYSVVILTGMNPYAVFMTNDYDQNTQDAQCCTGNK